MKITRNQLRQLIVEQYAAMANSRSMPLKSRATPEIIRLIKGQADDAYVETDSERLTTEDLRQMIGAEIRKNLSGFFK